jgi:Domain of unknown function (DUF3471)/Glyoxalase superfamily protein
MRDFRDAKVMAQTLREALTTKSVALTHSESLELIAKLFGCHDWNVLAAKIKSESNLPVAEPARQEVAVAASILDEYVGFYKLNDNAVLTVTRDEDHLITQLTGQGTVPIYAESNTEFFAKVVHAEFTFVIGAKKHATSLIMHQNEVDIPLERIDGASAQAIANRTAEKVKSQSASPGTEPALRRLIDGLTSGTPNYDEMSPALAEATRRQLPTLRAGLAEVGAVQSVRFLGVGAQGEDVYTVRHDNGAAHWRIVLDLKGQISTAWVTSGP